MLLFYKICRPIAGRALVVMLGLFILLIPLASCSSPEPLQMTTVNLGIPPDALNSPIVGPLPDETKLHVGITFKIDPNLLKQAEQSKIEPGKSSNLDAFAKKIGISDSTYQKIKDFFNPAGVALKLSKLRTHLNVDAKAGTLAKLLQTKFVTHKYNDRTFYAPANPPKLPNFLANSIDAITGLDNYSAPPVHALADTFQPYDMATKPAADCLPPDQVLLPREVAGAYGFSKLWDRGLHGENMTINLVEIDGSYRSDIDNYLSCINFKGQVSSVNVDGAPREALGESTLDIQMAAGLARSSNIVVYQTDGRGANDSIWTNINDMLQAVIDNNVNNANAGSVVSISLGTDERDMTSDDIIAIDRSIQQLTQVLHMTVFIASGDCGAFTSRAYGKLSVSFPASDPWATAVGGTILSVDGNSNRANEIVWSDGSHRSSCNNRWGTGGGNSALFKRPDWQSGAGVNNQYSKGQARQLPDVSAAAYALAVYFKGQWGAVGGTSAAAPIWATGIALVNQGMLKDAGNFGYSPRIFYTVANQSGGMRPYYDVTQGNNLYYPATPGWDYSTGFGTPNLADFYQALRSTL